MAAQACFSALWVYDVTLHKLSVCPRGQVGQFVNDTEARIGVDPHAPCRANPPHHGAVEIIDVKTLRNTHLALLPGRQVAGSVRRDSGPKVRRVASRGSVQICLRAGNEVPHCPLANASGIPVRLRRDLVEREEPVDVSFSGIVDPIRPTWQPPIQKTRGAVQDLADASRIESY